jgi:hypothetical protein
LVYIDYILNDTDYVKKDMVVMTIKPCYVERVTAPYDCLGRGFNYSVPLATKGIEEKG